MELGLSNTLLAGDTRLIDHIVGEVKSQGIFDQFRKECIADVDTKPAYQNLRTRVEGSVNSFLNKQIWKQDLNKNQLRETLRKHIHDAPYLDAGVERIVDQVVNPKVYSVFMSQIEDVVYKFLGVERPKAKEKNGACGLKDLLPKDLDPVSPESDKNSLKDVSLESLDASDNLNGKHNDEGYNEQKVQNEETREDKNKFNSENGHISSEERVSEEACKFLNRTGSNLNLNISGKSDDKIDEEEEDSPMFEPIDIMNLNESNISNDSHLSGISELTSHRSKSPDFSNELSRDNFDYNNQDSQLSKVSSDSRLSIITDFGSSNHGLTPVHDASKEETAKDKYEAKNIKDNFKAIREFDSSKNKMVKNNFDLSKGKETQDYKDKDCKSNKNILSKENSHDTLDIAMKTKYEHKSLKMKNKNNETTKLKNTKERISTKDTKYYKDKSNNKKRLSSHSNVKYDKCSKHKSKDKIDQSKEGSDKTKDISENIKDNKFKEEKLKETEKKDNISKEAKDLKDLYKEKIRELREKKELTEKEKLNKDKDVKLNNKEVKDKKDSPKDRKSSKKEHKGTSSSSSSSSSSKNLSVITVGYHESKTKTTEKTIDGKDRRSDLKDKTKRDEKRLSKESKSKSHYSSKTDLSDLKKILRIEKEEKIGKTDMKRDIKTTNEKTNGKKDTKNYIRSKSSDRNEKLDGRKDSKNDNLSRDKKRRDDKKSKTKDDHSSLRKNSNDRRSTDRDGPNGSNSKTTQSSNSNSNVTSNKSGSSSLTKENQINNSSSETSDSIEEMQVNNLKLSHESSLSHKIDSQLSASDKSHFKTEEDSINEAYEETDMHETILPLKKRPLINEHNKLTDSEMKIKKPKFAKNIHEAKRLMKIRKQMEKQKFKEDKKMEKKTVMQEIEQKSGSARELESMPDDERVQIIEIPDEEYDEPYPEKQTSLTLDESSIIMLGAEHCTNNFLKSRSSRKQKLSNIESCIKKSLSNTVSNIPLKQMVIQTTANDKIGESNDLYQQSFVSSSDTCLIPLKNDAEATKNLQISKEDYKDNFNESSNYVFGNKRTTLKEKTHIYNLKTEQIHVSRIEEGVISKTPQLIMYDEDKKQPTEKDAECKSNLIYYEVKKLDNNRTKIQDDKEESSLLRIAEIAGSKNKYVENRISSTINEDDEDCRYFKTDNEKLERFSKFLESYELRESSLEDMIESLGGRIVSLIPKSMAPPWPKRKCTFSPLSDILVNNSDNNNDGHKQTLSAANEDAIHNIKRRKLITKKQRFPSLYNPQGISNGENFVMPLSPESDVSATSEKTSSSNIIKEEKSRNRSSQRYSSDDLYKPRPLFSSSSRRSRRSNQV